MLVMKNSKTTYRKEAIKAADELGYSPAVIKKLKKAKTESEITRILTDARRGILK